jgi:hypothetical protein
VRLPETPVKVIDAVAAAVLDALRVTDCAVPGVKVRVAGLAVTPAGRPDMETATVPLNAFAAVASTLVLAPAAPADMVREAGERVREKFAAGAAVEMVTATVIEWVSDPEVPLRVSVALPAAAVDAAVSVTLCAVPGVSVSVAGLAVTPVGSPLIESATFPVKPFAGTAFTLICFPAPPAVRATVAGVAVNEKSVAGAAAEMVAVTATEWVRDPEVPVRVSVALPATAVEAAVSVMLCAVPGVNVSVAGFAVTPAGSPLIATATLPVKPFAGTAFKLICFAAPPAVRATVAGVAVNEKSAAGAAVEMVVVTVAEWVSVPEAPVRVSVALPAAVVEAAVSVTLCAVPGVNVSVAGFAVTPAGSPPIETATFPEKPFAGTAFTLICLPAPPVVNATVAGVDVSEKSAIGVETVAVEDPLPQDARATHKSRHAAYAVFRRLGIAARSLRVGSESATREVIVCRVTGLQFFN